VCAAFLLREFTARGAEMASGSSARNLGVVVTTVSSCSSSSLAVPVVEFDTLSMDRRDMISSRVDAFIGRIEKREEIALARRPEDWLGPLECAEMVAAGDWERE